MPTHKEQVKWFCILANLQNTFLFLAGGRDKHFYLTNDTSCRGNNVYWPLWGIG